MSEDLLVGMLGIIIAGFCIWLTIRIINRRERWAIRTATATAVVITLALALAATVWYLDRYVIGGGP